MHNSNVYDIGLSALGLVPNGKRPVTPVPAHLLRLVPKPKGIAVSIKAKNADPVKDTIPFMQKRMRETAYQVEKLVKAKELRGSSVAETVRKYWDFIFKHIQYVPDPKNKEVVRDPSVMIHEGKGDCDCFTETLGSMMIASGIPFEIRIADYDGKGWGHVYMVVPKDGNGKKKLNNRSEYIVVDPVVHRFDYEEPFKDKKDFSMELVSLRGPQSYGTFGACDTKTGSGEKTEFQKLRRFVPTQSVIDAGLIPTQQFLESEKIPYTQNFDAQKDAGEFVINTPGGELKVPSIISKEQAAQLKQLMASAGNTASNVADDLKKNFKWWWLAAAGVLAWLLFGGDDKEKPKGEKNVTINLNGPKKENKKKKAPGRKAKAKSRALPSLTI